jgi:hypothetical protein
MSEEPFTVDPGLTYLLPLSTNPTAIHLRRIRIDRKDMMLIDGDKHRRRARMLE